MVIFTPFTIWFTWGWFRKRILPSSYYAEVAVSWTVIAIVLDYLFIVLLFHSQDYYKPDVFVYYAVMFLAPVGIGVYLKGYKTE